MALGLTAVRGWDGSEESQTGSHILHSLDAPLVPRKEAPGLSYQRARCGAEEKRDPRVLESCQQSKNKNVDRLIITLSLSTEPKYPVTSDSFFLPLSSFIFFEELLPL